MSYVEDGPTPWENKPAPLPLDAYAERWRLTDEETETVERAARYALAYRQRNQSGQTWERMTAGDVIDEYTEDEKRRRILASAAIKRANQMQDQGRRPRMPPKAKEPPPRPDLDYGRSYTDEDADGMIAMRRCGYTLVAIADEYGCAPSTVSRLTQGWDDAPESQERAA